MQFASSTPSYRLALLAAALTFLVYVPAIGNGFVNWDDGRYLYENPLFKGTGSEIIRKSFTGNYVGNWHPLTMLTYAAGNAVWGMRPAGYHAMSVTFHALNTFLVILLVHALLGLPQGRGGRPCPASLGAALSDRRSVTALLTGLLFGLHPIHVESVAWVSEWKDVLSAFFFLLSLLSYIRFATGGGPVLSTRSYYRLSLGLFALSLMSKPMAITLPVVLLILDWCPLERFSSQTSYSALLTEKLPFFLLSLASAVITILAQGDAISEVIPFSARMLVACRSYVAYLGKMLWPSNLLPFYPYPKEVPLLSGSFLLPVLILLIAVVVSLALARKQRFWAATLAYFLVTLAPVIGFIQVGSQAMADRYAYLPSIAPFLIAGIGAGISVGAIRQEAPRKATGLVVIAVLSLVMAVLTTWQIGIWKDGKHLWTKEIDAMGATERSFIGMDKAHANLGQVYLAEKEYPKALDEISRAIQLEPRMPEYYVSRAFVYKTLGMLEWALSDLTVAISLDKGNGVLYAARADINKQLRLPEDAVEDYGAAIALSPENADLYYNRGNVMLSLGRLKDAERDYTRAITIRPHRDYYNNRAFLYRKMGRFEEAGRDAALAQRSSGRR